MQMDSWKIPEGSFKERQRETGNGLRLDGEETEKVKQQETTRCDEKNRHKQKGN